VNAIQLAWVSLVLLLIIVGALGAYWNTVDRIKRQMDNMPAGNTDELKTKIDRSTEEIRRHISREADDLRIDTTITKTRMEAIRSQIGKLMRTFGVGE
jgi:predicted PurR-regulated permease PerM